MAHPELLDTELPELYKQANIFLSQIGRAYLHENSKPSRIYNKTKHGFVVVNDSRIFDPSARENTALPECLIVLENAGYDPTDVNQKYTVELYDVGENLVEPIDRADCDGSGSGNAYL
jgi:hypothetical protein